MKRADVAPGRDGAVRGVAHRTCNLCGSDRFRPFKRLPRRFPRRIHGDRALTVPDVGRRLRLQYLQCTACGLVGINPTTHFADIHRTFRGERNVVAWADLDFDWYAGDKRASIGAIHAQYELDRYRKLNRVLDVGCGPGVSLAWLRDEQGWDVAGIDADLHSVELARERYGVAVQAGFVEDAGHGDQSADLVLLDNALEHIFDPQSALLAVHRILRDGGGLFIAVPNADGLATRYGSGNAEWGHWFLFTPRTLTMMLEGIGFTVRRLFAVQPDVPEVARARGVAADAFRAELSVQEDGPLAGEAARSRTAVSDFFHILAEKQADAVGDERRAELAAIARRSLVERREVTIEGDVAQPPGGVWRWLRDRFGR